MRKSLISEKRLQVTSCPRSSSAAKVPTRACWRGLRTTWSYLLQGEPWPTPRAPLESSPVGLTNYPKGCSNLLGRLSRQCIPCHNSFSGLNTVSKGNGSEMFKFRLPVFKNNQLTAKSKRAIGRPKNLNLMHNN